MKVIIFNWFVLKFDINITYASKREYILTYNLNSVLKLSAWTT